MGFTRNWSMLCAVNGGLLYDTSYNTNIRSTVRFTNTSGSVVSFAQANPYGSNHGLSAKSRNTQSSGTYYPSLFYIGSSNRAESIDDYALGSIIGSCEPVNTENSLREQLVDCKMSSIGLDANDNAYASLTIQGVNNTSASFTIKEMGMTARVPTSESSGSPMTHVLIWRKVLETPLTVPVGKHYLITVKLNFGGGS